jgi:hypothetical protein
MSMKNSNATILNRTRDLPACSTMPQPTGPPPTTSSHLLPLILGYQLSALSNFEVGVTHKESQDFFFIYYTYKNIIVSVLLW